MCSNTTNEILQRHVLFASLMAQRIDDASKSQYNLKCDGPETTKLAKDINEASRSLSKSVTQMTNDLTSLVSALEKARVRVKKERSLVDRILGWLKALFKAIAMIFVTLSPSIAEFLRHHPDPRVQGCALAITALGQAASVFCAMDSGAFPEHIVLPCKNGSDRLFDAESKKGKESESLDSVIIFLRQIVPNEAKNAQMKLERFDEALDIMELECKINAGRRVTLYGSDPATVAEEWRNVAERYQSALERKICVFIVIQNYSKVFVDDPPSDTL